MKIITFVCLTFVVLSIGCFDGDRGVLTELLPDVAPPVQVREPLPAEIAVGTGSELVVSPVPTEIEDALWGSWGASLDYLELILSIPEFPPIEKTESTVGSFFTPFCEDVHRRLFYDKYIDAGGIAILAPSERSSLSGVRDEFLYAAREIILTMTSETPALRQVLSPAHGFRYVLVSADWVYEVYMPLELRKIGEVVGFYRSGLAVSGLSWSQADWEVVLGSIAIVHEMAHAIDDAFDKHPHLFPDWGTRLTAAFEAATAKAQQGKGFFDDPDYYALTNEKEYWAVGASEWFSDTHGDNLHDELQRARLIEQDPLLYALLDEVFPAVDWPTYIRIAAE